MYLNKCSKRTKKKKTKQNNQKKMMMMKNEHSKFNNEYKIKNTRFTNEK